MKNLKKCFILLLVISFVIFLNGCLPFWKTYFTSYENYVWTSTKNSDIELTFYQVTPNNSTDYGEMTVDGKVQPIGISTFSEILIFKVDNENDVVNFDKFLVTKMNDIKDNIFRSNVQSDSIFNKYTGLTIEVEGKPIAENDLKPFMFSPLSYSSHTDNLELHTTATFNNSSYYFLKQFGTMTIDKQTYNIFLKFFINNTFEIYDSDNENNILYAGTTYLKDDKVILDIDVSNITELNEIILNYSFVYSYI